MSAIHKVHVTLTKEVEALKAERATVVAKLVSPIGLINHMTLSLNFIYVFGSFGQDSVTLSAANTDHANHGLRSRIVQSPERLKKTIVDMGSQASQDRTALSANEAKARDLQARLDFLTTVEQVRAFHPSLEILFLTYSIPILFQDIKHCIDLLKDLEEEEARVADFRQKLEMNRANLKKKNIEYREVEVYLEVSKT